MATAYRPSAGQAYVRAQAAPASLPLAMKRAIDIVGSLLALLCLAPLFAFTALVIWIVDPGPVFYSQERVGRDGQMFRCLKFRTMVMDAERRLAAVLRENAVARLEWELFQKLRDDPRITPFGRLLRLSSVDEIPQFINVLRGDMSLVGPRPIVRAEASRYARCLGDYLKTKPGLTGLWQVSGRNDTSYRRRIACDVLYSRRWSLGLDFWIMLRTVPALVASKGCY